MYSSPHFLEHNGTAKRCEYCNYDFENPSIWWVQNDMCIYIGRNSTWLCFYMNMIFCIPSPSITSQTKFSPDRMHCLINHIRVSLSFILYYIMQEYVLSAKQCLFCWLIECQWFVVPFSSSRKYGFVYDEVMQQRYLLYAPPYITGLVHGRNLCFKS